MAACSRRRSTRPAYERQAKAIAAHDPSGSGIDAEIALRWDCTQIGNDDFTWFGTTGSKSRLNFLECLRAGHTDYVINDAALAYMRGRSLSCSARALLANHPTRHFADQDAWMAHLQALGLADLKVSPDPVGIATEGALWGSVTAHGFLCDAVVVSDNAGQFDVGHHALCWVHAERLVHKLDAFTEERRRIQGVIRGLIWDLYRDLWDWDPNPSLKAGTIQIVQAVRLAGRARAGRCARDRPLVSG